MYSESQVQIFVIISSVSIALFVLTTIFFIVKLKLKDIRLKRSEKKLKEYSDNLESLVDEKTHKLMKTEKSYKSLYEINQGILENSPAGIIKLNSEFEVEYENPEMKRILGVDPEDKSELMNKDIRKNKAIKKSGKVHVISKLLDLEKIDTELHFKLEGFDAYFTVKGVPLIEDEEFTGAVLLINDITRRKKAQAELNKAFESAIEILSDTLGIRDAYTVGHQTRVSRLAKNIAMELSLPDEQIKSLEVASVIHDIGKIKVPSEILSKPGKLSEIEFSYLKEHPIVGYDLLRDVDFPWPVADIIYQHHERLNGSGYPRGLKGDKIMLEAQILAVADVVEAMSSRRPYRPALGIETALEEIRKNMGKLYNPKVARACFKVMKNGFQFEEKKISAFE